VLVRLGFIADDQGKGSGGAGCSSLLETRGKTSVLELEKGEIPSTLATEEKAKLDLQEHKAGRDHSILGETALNGGGAGQGGRVVREGLFKKGRVPRLWVVRGLRLFQGRRR